jgi:hypothetical protein
MKTFIFIFILVVGFFFYLFTNSDNAKTNASSKSITYNLEEIEQTSNIKTEQEVKESTSLSKEEPIAIPEDQTFDTIKNILKEASGREYGSEITLNTQINAYLYTVNAKEKFKQSLSSRFNLSHDKIEQMSKKNRLVWDWVNDLKE